MDAPQYSDLLTRTREIRLSGDDPGGALIATFHTGEHDLPHLVMRMTSLDDYTVLFPNGDIPAFLPIDKIHAYEMLERRMGGYLNLIARVLKRWDRPLSAAAHLYPLLERFLPLFVDVVAESPEPGQLVSLLIPLGDAAGTAITMELTNLVAELDKRKGSGCE